MTSRLIVLALLSLGAVQAPVFRSGVETVRVDVLVSRGGLPVQGLGADDFEVLDSGVVQRIDHVAFEEIPLNVVLAIDTSSSLEGEREQRLREACRRVLAELRSGDQAGLVVFSNPVVIRSELTEDLDAVRAAVDLPLPRGQTSLVDAVQASVVLAESQPGRALILIFSDGIEVSSYLPADAILEAVKRTDAVVYGVTVRGRTGARLLPDLSDATGGDTIEIESAREIEPAFRRVLDEFRRRYLLSYTPSGVSPGGWHPLKVRVKTRGADVKARPGYFR